MRLETFLKTFASSISNPKYYVDVLNVRMWFTLRFLLCSYVLITLIAAVLFSIVDVPKLRGSLTSFITTGIDQYPKNQTISWNGLMVNMSGSEKYSLAFPNFPDLQNAPAQLLEVNPSITEVTQISQTESQRSLVVIGKQTAYLAQPGGGWSELALTDILTSDTFEITSANLTTDRNMYLDRLNSTLRALPFLFTGFFFFVSLPLRLFSVLIDSILIYFMVRISNIPLSFKKVLQISLHVTVAAELLTVLTANFSQGLQMFSLTFWGYSFLIYWNLRHIKSLKPIETVDLNKE